MSNYLECDDFSANLSIDCQNPVSFLCGRKLSGCATGVEPENIVPEFVLRPMTVPVNNCLDLGELGPQPLL